jgi:uncharacterized protein (TIRG00374 family)
MSFFRKLWRRYLPIIGIALFLYIIWKLGIEDIFSEIIGMNPIYLLAVIPLTIFSLFVQTFKWFLIARKQKIDVPFMEANKINLVSNFYGAVTPSKIGSIIRAEHLKKYTGNIGKGASNFVLDKVMDLSSLFFIAVIFSFVFKEKFGNSFLIFSSALLVFMLLSLIVFLRKERARKVLRIVYNKLIPDRFKEKAKITFDSFYEDAPKSRFLLAVFIVNLFNWILLYFTSYIIGLSIGMEVPFIYFLAILPLGTVVAQIPISISGLGTREAALISLFGILGLGISAAKIFSMSLLSLFFMMIVPSVIAIIIINVEKNIDKDYKAMR